MSFEIGKTFNGREVEQAPAGAVVVDEQGKPHVRAEKTASFGYVFEDHSSVRGVFTLVWLPQSLDLADRRSLAQELLRQRTDDPTRKLDDHFGVNNWLRAADWVLANFVPKASVPLREGDKFRLITSGHQDARYTNADIGDQGVLIGDLDSDDEYEVKWDGTGLTQYLHKSQVERA
jgi:hypothetical protein